MGVCAISGMVGLPYTDATIEKMLSTMERRGPDSRGSVTLEDCCLLHSRLAVIDRQGGKQPMTLSWGQETYTLVYNGELYNTQEIRDELCKLEHCFYGHSDTEVVLHAYVQWGGECVHRFNGIFAFAVWEHKEKRLFLARDRMGVKPLFFSRPKGKMLFASEIKTILAYPDMQPCLDADAVAQVLLLGPGRIPGSGVFHGIYELEPGCCGVYAEGRWQEKRYWQLLDREHTESFEETAQHVRYLVTDAIARQMVSDVPLGTFLSGGLDSSLISSVCSREMAKQGKKLSTFSLDFENNDRYFVPGKFQPTADTDFIRVMQNDLQSEHHWTVQTPETLVQAMEKATLARDLPGMADVDFSLLAFCGDIRKHVTVALSGECADEIFGGYPWYRDPEVRALQGFPWAQNTGYRAAFIAPAYREQIDPEAFVTEQYEKTCRESDILPGTSPQERRMKEMVNLNYRWFMQTLLDRKDRMSMYHALEVRVPFCDYRIAEYLYGVPWEFKDYQGKEKGLLRYAMAEYLPREVLWRKKSPYPKTHDPHYLEIVSGMLRQILKDKTAPILQIVRREALEGLLTAEFSWPWYGQLMRLPQTIAYMLQINFWMQTYNIQLL